MIERLYGLNVNPAGESIWEYKEQLPYVYQLMRSTSEKENLHIFLLYLYECESEHRFKNAPPGGGYKSSG